MDDNQSLTPNDARASLDIADGARSAVVATTRQPVWPVLMLAAAIGACIGLLSLGDSTATTVGQILLLAALVGFALLRDRFARTRGEIFDKRFLGAVALRFVPGWIVFGALTTVKPPPSWQPWYAIGLGLAAAGAAYLAYAWADNYRARRLAAGDYDPSDLA